MPDSQQQVAPGQGISSTAEARCQAWYEAYGRAVYSYVRFHLPSADMAEDVTADTFLKAFRAADRFDESRGHPRTWIFRIAQNTLRDHLRRSRLRRHLPIGSMRDLATDAPSPEERLLWEEQVARLLDGVAMLGPRDREVISLRYGSGLDTAEVAQVLGVREPAVRTRLWRALDRLRAILVEPEQ
ncbi:MAG TPA: sigma-70 family RNA polymerase sigma factor [Gemmatimonadales bacterium]|nr:sigma-70 family RNA polymerase sigma factor [Gemmatimonadales bacterium]